MDVLGDIRDEEGQDELEGQQPVLGTHSSNNQHVRGATVVSGLFFLAGRKEMGYSSVSLHHFQ